MKKPRSESRGMERAPSRGKERPPSREKARPNQVTGKDRAPSRERLRAGENQENGLPSNRIIDNGAVTTGCPPVKPRPTSRGRSRPIVPKTAGLSLKLLYVSCIRIG